MLFAIDHKISFEYSRAVFLEPSVLRLKPRTDANQQLLSYELKIGPRPEGFSEVVDLEGASASHVWFLEKHSRLTISTHSETRTFKSNPFDFILTGLAHHELPISYPSKWKQLLAPYQQNRFASAKLDAFCRHVRENNANHVLDFLIALARDIHQQFDKLKRDEGHPLAPDEVLKRQEGSCRDLTLLYLEVCRSLGFAARYVSGYTRGDDRLVESELHAWAEVYLPGGAWRGFDPTLGLAVADQHVALTASPEPELTLPTEGSFRGSGVTATMEYEVRIRVEE